MNATEMKIAAAREALAEVRDGMRLGLGTGSTSMAFGVTRFGSMVARHALARSSERSSRHGRRPWSGSPR